MKNPFKRKKRLKLRRIIQRFNVACSRLWSRVGHAFAYLAGNIKRRAFLAKLRQGDIILASPRTLKLSPVNLMYRLLLRARYVHSMLYLGDGKIIHTTTKRGVLISHVPRKIFKKAHYNVFRIKHLSREQRERVIQEALKLRGQQLDPAGLITNIPARVFGFRKPLLRLEQNRLWCAKLIYKAYSAAGIELVPSENKENIISEDLSHSPLLSSISHKR